MTGRKSHPMWPVYILVQIALGTLTIGIVTVVRYAAVSISSPGCRAVLDKSWIAPTKKGLQIFWKPLEVFWLRGRDLNPRPLGYEPNELPDCSTPRHRKSNVSASVIWRASASERKLVHRLPPHLRRRRSGSSSTERHRTSHPGRHLTLGGRAHRRDGVLQM